MTRSSTDAASAALRIYLLGPPQITWRGEALDLTRRQARALLFYLAHTLEPASRDRLAFYFWPDLPDLDARHNLKRLLSTLSLIHISEPTRPY